MKWTNSFATLGEYKMQVRHLFMTLVLLGLTWLVWSITRDLVLTMWVWFLNLITLIEWEILGTLKRIREGERKLRQESQEIVEEYLGDAYRALPVMLAVTFGLASASYFSLNRDLNTARLMGIPTIFLAASASTLPAWISNLRAMKTVKVIYSPTLWWFVIQVASLIGTAVVSGLLAKEIGISPVEDVTLVTIPFVLSYVALYRFIVGQVWNIAVSGPEASLTLLGHLSKGVIERSKEDIESMVDKVNRFVNTTINLGKEITETGQYVRTETAFLKRKYQEYKTQLRACLQEVPNQQKGDMTYVLCGTHLYRCTLVTSQTNKSFVILAVENAEQLADDTKEKLASIYAWSVFSRKNVGNYYSLGEILSILFAPIRLFRHGLIGTMPALFRRNMNDWLSAPDSDKSRQFASQLELDITATEDFLLGKIETKLTRLHRQLVYELSRAPCCETAKLMEEVLDKIERIYSEQAVVWGRRKNTARLLIALNVTGSSYIARTSEARERWYIQRKEDVQTKRLLVRDYIRGFG